MEFGFDFYSKQNQLWMEGVEFYKGCPYNKAPPYEYGIYSIKQREMFKSTNGNGVQNISQKVDTMKLNDSHATAAVAAAKTLPVSVSITNREFLHRDENKNTTTLPCSLTVGVSTRRKVIAPATAADIDNNNDHFDKNATVASPTQGDTLNQIKAMRRRHTRMAANLSPVSTGL